MYIKEDHNEDLIFADRNGITLEIYNCDSNTHEVTIGVDSNLNNYNSRDAS